MLAEYEPLPTTELHREVKAIMPAHQTVVQEIQEALLVDGIIWNLNPNWKRWCVG
jgi:ectoine hydroxylase-related dioxygenase (phytanoyl-CoA dioxygenase family)